MLDQLGAAVGDIIQIGGTPFEVRGTLGGIPDAPVRGFRLGVPARHHHRGARHPRRPHLAPARPRHLLPLQGPARRHATPKTAKAAVEAALGDPGLDRPLRARRARPDGALLRPLHALPDDRRPRLAADRRRQRLDRHLGLCRRALDGHRHPAQPRRRAARASSSTSSPRSRRSPRSASASASSIGGGAALVALPIVGQAVGVALPPTLHVQPLLIAAGVGLITAFAFSYLPLLQALAISPVTLFRAKGLAAPAHRLGAAGSRSIRIVPLIVAVAALLLARRR